jgi:hypothetical protein
LPNPWSQLSLINPADINTIPEFPLWIILLLFLTAILTFVLVRKRLTKTRTSVS